jgi:hypothetical protein
MAKNWDVKETVNLYFEEAMKYKDRKKNAFQVRFKKIKNKRLINTFTEIPY